MNRPLVAILIYYICGVLVGYFFTVPTAALLFLGAAALFLVLADRYSAGAGLRLSFMAVLVMGVMLCQWQITRNSGNIQQLAGKQVEITGTVCQEPDIRLNGTNYVVKLENGLRGRLLVAVTGGGPGYSYGDRLEIRGVPETPGEPGNPGEFNYRKYLKAKGIQLVLKTREGWGIKKTGRGRINPLVDTCLRIKQRLMTVLFKTLSPRHAGLMGGILFGSYGLVDAQARNDFALTGVIHILSVSGYHMGLLIGLCLALGNALRIRDSYRNILTVCLTGFYAVMTGGSPPVLRSLLMAWVLILAQNVKRKYSWPTALSFAALIILAVNPLALFNSGFQLSFAATWGVLYLAPYLTGWVMKIPGLKDCRPVAADAGVTVAAQTAVFPITSYYFNYFSLVSLPANLLIVPLISLVMLLGGLSCIAGLVWLPAGAAINVSTGFVLDLTLWLARLFSQIPYGVIPVKQPSILEIVSFYFILTGILEVLRNPQRLAQIKRIVVTRRQWLALAGLAMTAVGVWTSILFSGQGKLEVTFLDIGQGDAAVICTPNGRHVLIDCGGTQTGASFQPGDKVLLPYLRRKGISTVDLLVLTHAHADHIQGAEALLGRVTVKAVTVPAGFAGNAEGERLLSKFAARGTEINRLGGGEILAADENITLEVLNPDEAGLPAEGDNNSSLVLRLEYRNLHILFTGDAENPVLANLSKHPDEVRAEIVKVPHHGSKNGWLEEFYQAVDPELAVVSVGPNYFGHPSDEVLRGLRVLEIGVLRTDEDGAVIIRSDGDGYDISTGR